MMSKTNQKNAVLLATCFFLMLLVLSFILYWWPLTLKDGQIVELALKKNIFASSNQLLRLEIVRSPERMKQGLGGRPQLVARDGQAIDGMLFIYPSKKTLSFWMKDMQFSIDICWLKNRQLLSCSREIEPTPTLESSELSIYQSPEAVNMVLETEPGFLGDELFGQKLFPHF